MFTAAYGRPPADARELSAFIARAVPAGDHGGGRVRPDLHPGQERLDAVGGRAAGGRRADRGGAPRRGRRHAGWLEREALYTRGGRGGVRQVDTTGLIAAAFTHRDSRAGDPDLHTHVAVSQQGPDPGRAVAGPGRAGAVQGRRSRPPSGTTPGWRPSSRTGSGSPSPTGRDAGRRQAAGARDRRCRRPADRVLVVAPGRDRRPAGLSWPRQFQAEHGRPPTASRRSAGPAGHPGDPRRKHEPRSLAEQRAAVARRRPLPILGSAAQCGGWSTRRHRDGRSSDTPRGPDRRSGSPSTAGQRRWPRWQPSAATWQVWHVRAEAERQARAAGIARRRLDAAVDAVVDAALWPAAVRSGSASDDRCEEPAAAAPRGRRVSVYEVAGSPAVHSRAVLAAERHLLDAAARRDGRAPQPTGRSTWRCWSRPPTASPSTTAKRSWSASWPPPAPGSSSPSPRPGPARPPPCATLTRAWTAAGGTDHRARPLGRRRRRLRRPRSVPTPTPSPSSTSRLDTGVHARVGPRHRPAHADHHRRGRHGRHRRPGPAPSASSSAAAAASASSATTSSWPPSPPAGCCATSPTAPARSPCRADPVHRPRRSRRHPRHPRRRPGRPRASTSTTAGCTSATSHRHRPRLHGLGRRPGRRPRLDHARPHPRAGRRAERPRPHRPARRQRRHNPAARCPRRRQPGQRRRPRHHPPQRPAAAHQRHRLGQERRPVDRHRTSTRRALRRRATTATGRRDHPARRLRRRARRTRLRQHRPRRARHHRRHLPHRRHRRRVPPTALRRASPAAAPPTTSTWSPPATATRTTSSARTPCSRPPRPTSSPRILARDEAQQSATSTARATRRPRRRCCTTRPPATTTPSASPPSTSSAPSRLAALDTAAERPRPGSPTPPPSPPCAPTWPCSPSTARPRPRLPPRRPPPASSTPPLDLAAVLDWRLDPTNGTPAGGGPLPWLPAVPAALAPTRSGAAT